MSDLERKAGNAYADFAEVRHGVLADRFTRSKKPDDSSSAPDWMGVLMIDCKAIKAGDNDAIVRMLFSQATSLDAIFVDLAARAASNFSESQYFEAAKMYLQLALKAQNQSRATLQTLGEILNPKSITITRNLQANVAGQQIVNNGGQVGERKSANSSTTRTGENPTSTNELLGEVQHEPLDTGAKTEASRVNQDVEAVGKVQRRKNTGGKKAQ